MEQSHVVPDDGRLPGDGRADGCAVPGSDGTGEGNRLSWSCGEKAYFL